NTGVYSGGATLPTMWDRVDILTTNSVNHLISRYGFFAVGATSALRVSNSTITAGTGAAGWGADPAIGGTGGGMGGAGNLVTCTCSSSNGVCVWNCNGGGCGGNEGQPSCNNGLSGGAGSCDATGGDGQVSGAGGGAGASATSPAKEGAAGTAGVAGAAGAIGAYDST